MALLLYYDQPPRTLTRGQIARASCYTYGSGNPIAAFLNPLTWSEWESLPLYSYSGNCPDPYDISPDTPSAPLARREPATVRDSPATGVHTQIRIHRPIGHGIRMDSEPSCIHHYRRHRQNTRAVWSRRLHNQAIRPRRTGFHLFHLLRGQTTDRMDNLTAGRIRPPHSLRRPGISLPGRLGGAGGLET